jgi:hypothetical protein
VPYRRREVLKSVGAAGVGGIAFSHEQYPEGEGGDYPPGQPPRGDPRPYDDYATRRVPADYDTIQAAVDDADPEDLVLVGPGVYEEASTYWRRRG